MRCTCQITSACVKCLEYFEKQRIEFSIKNTINNIDKLNWIIYDSNINVFFYLCISFYLIYLNIVLVGIKLIIWVYQVTYIICNTKTFMLKTSEGLQTQVNWSYFKRC